MITSLLRVVAALFALTFIVVACASDSGAQWTFAPVTVADAGTAESPGEPSAESTTPEGESVTQEEVGEVDPPEAAEAEELTEAAIEPGEAAAAEPEQSAQPATATGEGRVIQIQADGALRFTDAQGQQIQDIAVTPGETITFEVDNTAGFDHNFYIGDDSELMTPAGTTDAGIPVWSTGVQTLEWVVPDDISGLKFGCTVPGHYTLMQGTFSISE